MSSTGPCTVTISPAPRARGRLHTRAGAGAGARAGAREEQARERAMATRSSHRPHYAPTLQNLCQSTRIANSVALLRAPGCRCLSAFHGGFSQVRTPQISGSHSSDFCFALRRVRSTACECARGASLSMLQAIWRHDGMTELRHESLLTYNCALLYLSARVSQCRSSVSSVSDAAEIDSPTPGNARTAPVSLPDGPKLPPRGRRGSPGLSTAQRPEAA